jgi:hypothetical protein
LIVAVVIDNQKVIYPQISIILQEIGQAHPFVALGAKQQDIAGANLGATIGHRTQFAPLAKGAYQPAFALQPKAI